MCGQITPESGETNPGLAESVDRGNRRLEMNFFRVCRRVPMFLVVSSEKPPVIEIPLTCAPYRPVVKIVAISSIPGLGAHSVPVGCTL